MQTQEFAAPASTSGLLVVDSRLDITAIDGISASLLGISPDSAVGEPISRLFGDLRLEIELLAVLLFHAPFADYRIERSGRAFSLSAAIARLGPELGLFVSLSETR